ncbi:MAG: hypothetical protein LBF65_01730 [Holosporales bacterium]|nr:hypothetical protein [Holosporales bacterium]
MKKSIIRARISWLIRTFPVVRIVAVPKPLVQKRGPIEYHSSLVNFLKELTEAPEIRDHIRILSEFPIDGITPTQLDEEHQIPPPGVTLFGFSTNEFLGESPPKRTPMLAKLFSNSQTFLLKYYSP